MKKKNKKLLRRRTTSVTLYSKYLLKRLFERDLEYGEQFFSVSVQPFFILFFGESDF